MLKHVQSSLSPPLDSHQFPLSVNRSTDDAVIIIHHTVLSHLEQKNYYVRMLFVDYYSDFIMIISHILIKKPVSLGLPPSTCYWIKDFFVTSCSTRKNWCPRFLAISNKYRFTSEMCVKPFPILAVYFRFHFHLIFKFN